jgi:glutamate-1-semialdehyde aminotransferase
MFIDVTIHSVGACPLGYADPDVETAVIAAVRAGNMATLNCPEEVELAELLCELHPWADMVRYTRAGGEAMAVASRICRAVTGRDTIAISGYHGWHDWYLAANLGNGTALDEHLLPDVQPLGVPRALNGSVLAFGAGQRAEFDHLIAAHGDELAAIILEPAAHEYPPDGYLAHIKDEARRVGAVLVFDEITSGFRVSVGGIHRVLGVDPDVAVFAKGMSNGYPMGAVIGRREIMDAAGRTFVSSTSWSDRIGPAAALATINKLRREDVPRHLVQMGERMREGWRTLAEHHGLDIVTSGIPPLPNYAFQHGEDSKAMATLYTQCMFDEGFLASGAFYASYAHRLNHVDAALEATGRAFSVVGNAARSGRLEGLLRGPVAGTGLRKRS